MSTEEGWKLASDMNNIPFFEISCKDDNVNRIGILLKYMFLINIFL